MKDKFAPPCRDIEHYALGLHDLCSVIGGISKMVEVGSYIGESAKTFLHHFPGCTFYAIDPWLPNFDKCDYVSQNSDMSYAEELFDLAFKGKKNVIKLKMTSESASTLFDEKSLDLVYIDACHTYAAVCQDIDLWLPKVKNGGWMAFHDWSWPHDDFSVRRAIVEKIGNPLSHFRDDSVLFKIG